MRMHTFAFFHRPNSTSTRSANKRTIEKENIAQTIGYLAISIVCAHLVDGDRRSATMQWMDVNAE